MPPKVTTVIHVVCLFTIPFPMHRKSLVQLKVKRRKSEENKSKLKLLLHWLKWKLPMTYVRLHLTSYWHTSSCA